MNISDIMIIVNQLYQINNIKWIKKFSLMDISQKEKDNMAIKRAIGLIHEAIEIIRTIHNMNNILEKITNIHGYLINLVYQMKFKDEGNQDHKNQKIP
jgi:hypothetical protein